MFPHCIHGGCSHAWVNPPFFLFICLSSALQQGEHVPLIHMGSGSNKSGLFCRRNSFADFHGPTGFPRFCHFALGSQAASLRGGCYGNLGHIWVWFFAHHVPTAYFSILLWGVSAVFSLCTELRVDLFVFWANSQALQSTLTLVHHVLPSHGLPMFPVSAKQLSIIGWRSSIRQNLARRFHRFAKVLWRSTGATGGLWGSSCRSGWRCFKLSFSNGGPDKRCSSLQCHRANSSQKLFNCRNWEILRASF